MEIYLAELENHDFLFFVTRELKSGVLERCISNTALLYAINNLSDIHRTVSGNKPYYEEDWGKFAVYATPAKIAEFKEPVKLSYNAVDEGLAFKMEDDKKAIPKYGAYQKFPPQTKFIFYTIGGKGPGVLRVGKKGSICRVKYRKLEFKSVKKGRFRCSHPVNPRHMPRDFLIIDGIEIPIPPIRIFDEVVAEGEYIIAEDNKKHYIAIPDRRLFKGVFSGNSQGY